MSPRRWLGICSATWFIQLASDRVVSELVDFNERQHIEDVRPPSMYVHHEDLHLTHAYEPIQIGARGHTRFLLARAARH